MNYPIVSGIVVTDAQGNIVDSSGNVITRSVNKTLRDMDLAVLKRYVNSMKKRNALFVLGENTYNDLSSYLKRMINSSKFVVSDVEGAYSNLNKVRWEKEYDGKDQLLEFTFKEAFDQSIDDIAVLGGVSVYEAFSQHYREFVHCEIKEAVEGSQKNLTVIKDKIDENPYDALLTPTMLKEVTINTSAYKMTRYFQ